MRLKRKNRGFFDLENLVSRARFFLLTLIVFLIPSQLSLHFWPDWSLIFGIRVDYLSPAVYFNDLLILLIFILEGFSYVFKYKKNSGGVSMGFDKKFWLVFISWALINTTLAYKWQWSLIYWLRWVEFVGLAAYIFVSKEVGFKKNFLWPLLTSAVVFGALGIVQFFNGATVGGVWKFFGERTFTVRSSGIALVNILGSSHLRAYSTFPHPNALAGYLAMVVIVIDEFVKKGKLKILLMAFVAISLGFTFSKSAALALFAVLIIKLVNRANRFRNILKYQFIIGIFVVSLVFPVWNNFQSDYRILSGQQALKMFSSNLLSGVGANNFIGQMVSSARFNSGVWFMQPVHNLVLIILSEQGIIGAILTYLLVLKLWRKNLTINSLLVLVMVIGLVDHYWLTLYQNRLMLVITTSFLLMSLKKRVKI